MKSKSKMTQVFVWSVVPIALVLMLSLHTGGAQAATFVVNSTADVVDAAPGNGACATAGCDCTLRAAIMEANALPGADTIKFDPSAFSVSQTITLGSPLPAIAQDLTITGPGANLLTVNANQTGSVLRIDPGVTTTTISDLTMTGGKAGASSGGGIHAHGTLLTLTNVTVRGNTADYGGGIFTGGPVILNNSTISGNTAVAGGGGIINYINGTLTLNNSTVSGNSAGYGGGIAASNHGNTLILNNSTVSGNTGGGLHQQAGTVIMKNTILADNGGGNCSFPGNTPGGGLISRGHNLSTDIWCTSVVIPGVVSGGLNGPGDLNNTPAHLAPLAPNLPGSTWTRALCTGAGAPDPSCVAASPAINAVPSADCTDTADTPIASDQRGVSRIPPPGGACDIGAYEVACAPPPNNMVAWWPLDETSGTAVTDIVGGHNGTAQPALIGALAGPGPVTSTMWPPPTFPVGMVNNSLFFYGQRHIEVPSHSALEPGIGDFTIDAWVIYAASGNGQLLTVAQKNTGATAPLGNTVDGWRFVIRDSSTTEGRVSFRGSISVGGSVEKPITPNTWHHVAATLSTNASSVRIVKNYVDGVSSGQVGLNGNIASTAPLFIGGDGVGTGQIAVDELEIFNRALTQPEIQAIFNAGSAGKCKPVVNPNHPPVANAGPDRTVEATGPAGAAVTLNGSASSDPDGDPTTYTWAGSFGAVSGVSPTVNLPFGTNTVILTMSDGQATATDTVNITVHDTTPPNTIISSAVDGNGAVVASGGSTLSDYVAFTFGGIDVVGVAGFQCSLGGAAYAPCSSLAGYSALAIGSHIFQVRALDAAGNVDPSPASFIWTVVTPAQAINNLITTIGNMVLPGGVANNLSAPLGQASTLLNDNNPSNDIAACGKLNAFIDKVNAKVQNGQLTPAQASQLLQAANAIKVSLGC